MSNNPSSITQIRKIDNSRTWLPFATTVLIIALVTILVWFFKGGSFRLYASIFFGLYYITGQIWLSVILMGIIQNIALLPLRFISLKLSTSLKEFESQLAEIKGNDDEQYLVFKKKVREGNIAVVFYIFNFVVNAIAFFSAGRIFLIDFYSQKLDPNYLYSFIPYPKYPLQGTDFNFPFFKITETISLNWSTIFAIWIGITLFFAAIKLLWRVLKVFLSGNKTILRARIGYNRLLIQTTGFGLTTFFLSLFILRHIPVAFESWWLVADLTRQNTTMNFITAFATFLTTLHAGYTHHRLAAQNALKGGIDPVSVEKVLRMNMRQSFNNGLLLGFGAFFITNQIPCAFELSIATFEFLYILSPYTFDRFLKNYQPAPVNVQS